MGLGPSNLTAVVAINVLKKWNCKKITLLAFDAMKGNINYSKDIGVKIRVSPQLLGFTPKILRALAGMEYTIA